jgi:Zn-dependent protease
MSWWVASLWERDPILVVAAVFWVIGSIVLHELAHGWAALWAGDDTPRSSGHMTLNPLVHMGPIALLLFALVGVTWGAMPVNPSRFRRPIHEVVVAAAGPAMNIALFALCALAGPVWMAIANGVVGGTTISDPLRKNFATFLWEGARLNIVLMLLNLLPLPVLDGGRIVSYFVPPLRRALATPGGAIGSLLILFVVFSAIGPAFWQLGETLTGEVFTRVYAALGGTLKSTP